MQLHACSNIIMQSCRKLTLIFTLNSQSVFSLAKNLQLILEISAYIKLSRLDLRLLDVLKTHDWKTQTPEKLKPLFNIDMIRDDITG